MLVPAFILFIFGHCTRSRWQGQTGLFGQLFTGDHRSLGILLPMIDLKRIFHGTNELCTRCLHHASFSQGLSSFFLASSAPFRVKYARPPLIRPAYSAASTAPVHQAQRHALHQPGFAGAIQYAWSFRFGRVWVRAASIPTVTHRSRTRSTVRWCAPNALAISASHQPPPACASSAISRMRARLKRRADPVCLERLNRLTINLDLAGQVVWVW